MKFSIGEIAIFWFPVDSVNGEDFSYLHGEECEIAGYAPDHIKKTFNHDYQVHACNTMLYVMESELRKKPQSEDGESHYDGNTVLSWDDDSIVWRPTKETENE